MYENRFLSKALQIFPVSDLKPDYQKLYELDVQRRRLRQQIEAEPVSDGKPTSERRLLRQETVASHRTGRSEIFAAVKAFGVEGVSGGDDQFFLCVSPGARSEVAKPLSTGFTVSGSAT